jgi:SAM-dependent methyltransferase
MSRSVPWLLALALVAAVEAQEPRRAPDIHFAPTSPEVVMGMLKLAGVTPSDVVYDLGSGDGRIVIAAAENYGARGVGIELDPKLVAEATRNAEKAGVADRVRFIEGDLFEADISEATVVTLYLLEQLNEKLRPKLTRELRPGTRIVSHVFRMGNWRPDEQTVVGGRNVLLWRVPGR